LWRNPMENPMPANVKSKPQPKCGETPLIVMDIEVPDRLIEIADALLGGRHIVFVINDGEDFMDFRRLVEPVRREIAEAAFEAKLGRRIAVYTL
jgi:hypothetical protein